MSNSEDEFLDDMKKKEIKCGLGWYGLIMSSLIVTNRFNNEHPGCNIQIDSFEEKRGTLHIAVSGYYPYYLKYYFDKAAEASTHICEYCGCLGKRKKCNDGRHKTLCRRCRRKYAKRRRIARPDDALFDYMKKQIIHCGYGWYGLIFPIVAKLKAWNEKQPEKYQCHTATFRPNWSTLSINISGGPDIGSDEWKLGFVSSNICESCGCLGKNVDIYGWYKIRCPDCARASEEAAYRQMFEWFGSPSRLEEINQEEEKHEAK